MTLTDTNMDNTGAGKCPLCDAENRCAIALGEPPDSCWCQTALIAPEALAALPDAERGLRCICPTCARSAGGEKR